MPFLLDFLVVLLYLGLLLFHKKYFREGIMNTLYEVVIVIIVCIIVYFNRRFIKEKLHGLPFKKKAIMMLYFNAVPIIVVAAVAVYYGFEFIFP